MEIEWIHSVVLVPEIQDADAHLGSALEESVAREEIELPKIIAG